MADNKAIVERTLEFVRAEVVAAGQDREEVSSQTSLYRTGFLDSLGMLRVVEFLEQEFGITVGDDDVIPENFESADAIGDFVLSKLSSTGPASGSAE